MKEGEGGERWRRARGEDRWMGRCGKVSKRIESVERYQEDGDQRVMGGKEGNVDGVVCRKAGMSKKS